MICSISSCLRKAHAKGLCERHYKQQRLGRKTSNDVRERFSMKTVRASNGCLEWTGTLHKFGYGMTSVNYRRYNCHRLAWELAHGPIADGLQVLHKCDNPKCCDVEHLFLGTQKDNIYDGFAKGRIDRNRIGRLRSERCRHD